MKSVLITGGAGFIGSHLCELLLNKNFKVTCVDNLITGSRSNIAHLLKNNNFEFINLDISKEIVKKRNIDYIFHFASPASPFGYQNYPEETALVNSVGSINILNLAKRNKARVFMASTSEVYGNPTEHPQKETYFGNVNTFGPRSCYDESKRFAETMAYIYIHKYNMDIRLIRIFNTYGPRMTKVDGRAIPNFVSQAIEGKPLTVYADGKQTRSFCYITDLIDGIFKIMFSKGLKGEIVNLGNPDEYRLIDVAKKIKKLANSNSKIVFRPAPIDDPQVRKPDISKAKKLLNWKPKVNLNEGLLKTIEYYRS